jgi:molybdopterin/thiamine biosynthesis adenylyltransferase
MSDLESLRHSRHELLDGFDAQGVDAVRAAHVLIIGAGGLGCPAATYLAAAGIGHLTWVDGDTVDATNLARQVLFGPDDISQNKVDAGRRALLRLHPTAKITAIPQHADESFLQQQVPLSSVVLDCTDRWATRQMINRVCVAHRVPLVTAAAIEWSGQLMVIDPKKSDQACYACVFDPGTSPAEHACGAYGVLSAMVGAMGCHQAAEALTLIVSHESSDRVQRLSMLDMRSGCWQQLQLSRNPECPVCGTTRRR